ncbi:MAG TPA: AMP-binding protein, partial [Candidatus Angelobacter sp.]|nr:AMP-binding protein [Candidatus Angelobacter sp.]
MNIPLTPLRFLRYAAGQYPKKVGVICGEQRYTYSQFADRAARLGGALRALGVKPGDRVAFLSANCHRLLEAYYGVLEAGAVLLPLNIRLTPKELAYILNDSGARVLLFQEQFAPMVDGFRNELNTVESFVALDHKPAAWAVPQEYEQLLGAATPQEIDIMQVDENSLAELFYTSGTSANPKGVMLTHRNIYLHALNVTIVFSTGADSIELHTIPLFHANGWGVAHSLTYVGGTHVMIGKFDPPEVFRLIEKEKVQACSLVPTMATALVHCPDRPKYDLSTLQRITLGGAAASPTLVRQVEDRIGCICFSGYGLTETCPVLTTAQQKIGVSWGPEER